MDMMPGVQNDIRMSEAAQARLRNMSYARQDEFVSATPPPSLCCWLDERAVSRKGYEEIERW